MKALLITLVFLFTAAHAKASENVLRLYFEPTYPARLDWKSPKAVIESAINGIIRNRSHPIGHVNIEVSCGESEPLLAGAVGASAGVISNLLMTEKVGFSLLERGWEGSMEERAKILATFDLRGKDSRQLSVVTFTVSPEVCERLKAYHDQYVAETRPIHYGFGPRPRYREGAGCSAFGASFVEVAGLMTPELRSAWAQEQRIPLALMAGHAGKTEVPISEIRSSPLSARWALASEPHMLLEFFDPDKMYEWVKELAESPEKLAASGGTLDANLPYGISGVPAIRFEKAHLPLPEEPIFLGQPRLKPVGTSSVIRTDVDYARDGSFVLRP